MCGFHSKRIWTCLGRASPWGWKGGRGPMWPVIYQWNHGCGNLWTHPTCEQVDRQTWLPSNNFVYEWKIYFICKTFHFLLFLFLKFWGNGCNICLNLTSPQSYWFFHFGLLVQKLGVKGQCIWFHIHLTILLISLNFSITSFQLLRIFFIYLTSKIYNCNITIKWICSHRKCIKMK